MTPFYVFVLGTAIGSFLNVLIDRLPREEGITGRSYCDYCHEKLAPIDLIPVVSFLMLGGKCRRCGKKLSLFYPIVEVLTGIVFVLTWMYASGASPLVKIAYLGVMSSLIVIVFADLKYQIIPDQIQIALLLFTLVIITSGFSNFSNLIEHLMSAVVIMAVILALFLATRGRGMGFGDVKLAFLAGLLLGVKGGALTLYIAFVTGALYGSILVLGGRKKLKSKIAFGPFIVLGIVTVIFFAPQLFAFIYGLYGI